jgi:hypothetical protein
MIPISYQSIGFTFIMIMIACLVINQLVGYFKTHLKKAKQKSGVFEK